jgi:hypothetical protein
MKERIKLVALTFAVIIMFAHTVKAGNPERAGQAGASELLIDPWAGPSGFAGANSASIQGIEAQFLNVAGTALNDQTQVIIGNTEYLTGSGIYIASAGICQHVGKDGDLGISIMSMSFGSIDITTYDNPEGGVGTYDPSIFNIGVSYARKFADGIYGGLNVKLISESVSNVSALGVAVDAGIQYLEQKHKQFHFGIALKNVGPAMNYSGDGLAFETNLPNTTTGSQGTADHRSQSYDLPALVNIGAAYDFVLQKDSAHRKVNRLTVAANFTSNSFIQDQESVGVEYGFKNILSIRVGYCYENGIINSLSTNPVTGGRLTVFTGPCAGVSLQYPVGKKKTLFGISYAYRATNPYSGCHTIGINMQI